MIIAATLLLATVQVLAAVKTSARLEWDYPVLELLDVRFNVYHASNVSGPYTVFTNVATTNVTVAITEGAHFYYVTATNDWGESDPSNTAFAAVPRRGQNLKIIAQ